MHNPFVRPKPNPKREKPRRTGDRVRLSKLGLEALRTDRWLLSGGKCEDCGKDVPLTGDLLTRGHLAHDAHGSRKSDEIHRVKIKCSDCHLVKEHNPKSVPRKAGRKMNQKEALTYWKGTVCFCGGEKRTERSFCVTCLLKLDPQLVHDVENSTGTDYLTAMSLAENALLKSGTLDASLGEG